MTGRVRLLYLGMSGEFSVAPLRRLLTAGTAQLTVAYPQHASSPPLRQLPVRQPFPDCRDTAGDHGIDTIPVTFDWQSRLAELAFDALLVVCWPWRLPAAMLTGVPAGAYNIHPSLLPRYRGPDPLFWQLRDGSPRSGVTLHRLAAEIDAGAIVDQRSVEVAAGESEPALQRRLGALAGDQAMDLVAQLGGGTVPSRPQPTDGASYQPRARPADYQIPVSWSVQRAYRFIRGVEHRGHPFDIVAGARTRRVRTALEYHPDVRLSQPPWRDDGPLLQVQFADGILVAR